jgi:hypothetical protein
MTRGWVVRRTNPTSTRVGSPRVSEEEQARSNHEVEGGRLEGFRPLPGLQAPAQQVVEGLREPGAALAHQPPDLHREVLVDRHGGSH